MEHVTIDCRTCPVRGQRCDGCLMSVFPGFGEGPAARDAPRGGPSPVPLTLRTAPPDHSLPAPLPTVPPSGWDIPTALDDPDDLPLTVQERAAIGHAVRAGLVDPERAGEFRARRVSASAANGRRDAG